MPGGAEYAPSHCSKRKKPTKYNGARESSLQSSTLSLVRKIASEKSEEVVHLSLKFLLG